MPARTAGDVCVRCRKQLKISDRIQIAQIVDGVQNGAPGVGGRGVWVSEEFELTHVDCRDPTLTIPIVTK